MFQTRQRSLDAYYLFLEGQWSGGCRNGAELWRRLQAQGFRGSLRVVGEWTTRRRRSEAVSKQQLQRVPSARTIARLMTIKRDCMTKADAVVIAAIEAGVPSLVEARDAHRPVPRHDPKEGRGQTRCLDRERKSKPRLILRDGSPQGHRCRARCDHAPLVKRPGRRADYETQTCQTTNVWARENRPSRSTIARCSMIRDAVIKLRQSQNCTPKHTPEAHALLECWVWQFRISLDQHGAGAFSRIHAANEDDVCRCIDSA